MRWSSRTTSTRSRSSPASASTCRSRIRCAATWPRACSPSRASSSAQFAKVTYGNTSGGGLVALSFDMADVTVADETQAKDWIAQHPGQARILKTTRPVPGGMNMVVRQRLLRGRVRPPRRVGQLARRRDSRASAASASPSADAARQFTYVASLGITTPEAHQRRHPGQRRAGADLARQNVTDRRHAHAEGIRQRAHPRRGARALRREEPEGDRLRRQEGRLQRAEDDPEGQAAWCSCATARSAGSRTRRRGRPSPRATPRSTGSAAACPSGARSTCRSKAAPEPRWPSCRRRAIAARQDRRRALTRTTLSPSRGIGRAGPARRA